MTVDGVTCSECGVQLDTRSMDLPRSPCPNCEAEARTIHASSVAQLHIRGSASATVTAARENSDLPALLMQTLIIPDGRNEEGQLIRAVAVPWFEIIEAIRRDPSLVFQISARKWEEIIAGAYKRAGFDDVVLTPHSGDFGRDVIAMKRGLGTVRIIDQSKPIDRAIS
jgi:restriction system protein